jgi:hypothetical protein
MRCTIRRSLALTALALTFTLSLYAADRTGSLESDFTESLVRYHNLDGQGNGSNLPGVQLHPGITSQDALVKHNVQLSKWLAGQAAIRYIETPTEPAARMAFRKKLADERREAVASGVQVNLAAALAMIKNPAIVAATKKALAVAPPEFFTAPSSSSGKYHPADEINVGGLALHTARNVVMGDLLCKFYGIDGLERDEILAGLVLHDMKKGGEPWKGYDKAHGPLAAKWLGQVWKDQAGNAALGRIRELTGNHMAQWNAPQPSVPADVANQIVSYADYLAARDNVYVEVPTVGPALRRGSD